MKNRLLILKLFDLSAGKTWFKFEAPPCQIPDCSSCFGIYTNEFKIWEFGKAGAAGLRQRSGAEAAQLE